MSETAETERSSGAWPLGLLVAVIAVAGGVLVGGWMLGVEQLVRLRPDYAAMAPSTAMCLLILAGALLLSETGAVKGGARVAMLFAAAAVPAGVAAINLMVLTTDFATGIDSLLASENFLAGSMAPATSACVLLAANCVLDLSRPARRDTVLVVCATGGLLLCGVALAGYAFDVEALYEVSLFTAMALHTALAFALLFAALLLIRGKAGWVGVLLGPGGGSAGARRLFPVALVAPLVLCLAALWATRAGLIHADFGFSVLAILMVALLAAAILRNAVIENGVERKLRVALADRELLLREVHHRVKNNLQQINALLAMEIRNLDDEDAKASLMAMSDRVQALGAVHRLLVSSPEPSRCNTAAFLGELCAAITESRGQTRPHIVIEVEAEPLDISIDRAITVGLLVNEFITNAIKHAFEGLPAGRVTVRCQAHQGLGMLLSVADNGRGMPASEGWPGEGPGGRIISGLAAQLKAEVSVHSDGGAVVEVRIPPVETRD